MISATHQLRSCATRVLVGVWFGLHGTRVAGSKDERCAPILRTTNFNEVADHECNSPRDKLRGLQRRRGHYCERHMGKGLWKDWSRRAMDMGDEEGNWSSWCCRNGSVVLNIAGSIRGVPWGRIRWAASSRKEVESCKVEMLWVRSQASTLEVQ
jgi:hypothetical protein